MTHTGCWREKLDVAVKFIKGARSSSSSDNHQNNHASVSDLFESSEIKFLMRTRSPYVVLFLGCGKRGKDLFVMTEYCDGGSFDSVLWKRRSRSMEEESGIVRSSKFTWNLTERLHVLLDASEGLQFLHMLHRRYVLSLPNFTLFENPCTRCRLNVIS